MRPAQAHYITGCQQLLALGVVLVALTPAAAVVSLDVVVDGEPVGGGAARASAASALVPTAPVDPVVDEIELTEPLPGGQGASSKWGTDGEVETTDEATVHETPEDVRLVSKPQAVDGFGTVGVTWSALTPGDEEDLTIQVRSRDQGDWSGWTTVEHHDDHGPDLSSAEAAEARPGTDALVVGDVGEVQVRVESDDARLPADLTLAVVEPGDAAEEEVEAPDLDTAEMGDASTTADGGAGAGPEGSGAADASTGGASEDAAAETDESQQPALDLQAATSTPKPRIFSRAQWGANESWRDRGSLHYYEVHAGFVHHTVTSNGYTRDQVPGIIRSIYAYHTRSRGWSDIGYNFLVDRFGRIWEGRYGGVARPVVGAHTLGYNDYAFAGSALGNYDVAEPSSAMVRAFGRLMGWKLSLHGVAAGSTQQRVGSSTFRAINGHRDAGSTACPGRYLYAQLPRIRQIAAAAQRGWSGRELESSLAGNRYPDLLARRASDKRLFVVPTGGLLRFDRRRTAFSASGVRQVAYAPDLTHDGRGDLIVQYSAGATRVRPGNGHGGFGPATWRGSLAGHDLIAGVGDVTGDGRNDWVARRTATGELVLFAGRAGSGFRRSVVSSGWGGYTDIVGAGDVTGDRRPDLVVREGRRLLVRAGTGAGGFQAAQDTGVPIGAYDRVTGVGDVNRDGRQDLVVRRASDKRGFALPGNGNGTFQRRVGPIQGLRGWNSLAMGQVMGGQAPDLIGLESGQVVVRRSRGTFHLGRPINTGRVLDWANLVVNAGDWDRDGDGDVLARRRGDGALMLLRGTGTGKLEAATRIGSLSRVRLVAAVGDVTGDGWPDLMGQPSGGAMRIYPGHGDRLKKSYVAYRAISASRQIGVGRWDADGAPDSLFRQGDRLRFYPGNGPGGLTRGNRLLTGSVAGYDRLVGVNDMTGKGHADLVARAQATGRLWLLPGSSSGLGKRRFLGGGWNKFDMIS